MELNRLDSLGRFVARQGGFFVRIWHSPCPNGNAAAFSEKKPQCSENTRKEEVSNVKVPIL